MVFSAPLLCPAQPGKPSEYEVKAAYLYNFGKFVRWPVNISSNDIFRVCILGSDPFSGALEATVAGETIGARKISVRNIANVSDAAGCRIVFISSSEAGRMREILGVIGRAPVLTVSDMPNFVKHDGMIQFVMVNGRVRFEVNLTAAERAGLTLSSELLKVAIAVRREGSSGD